MKRFAWFTLGVFVCACSSAGEALFVSGPTSGGSVLSGPSVTSGAGAASGTGSSQGGAATSGNGSGTSQAASTTAVASAGSTGGGMDACAPNPMDKACAACVKMGCCSQVKACAADKNCGCMSECFGTQPNCQGKCGGWGAVWNNLYSCAQQKCGLQCALG